MTSSFLPQLVRPLWILAVSAATLYVNPSPLKAMEPKSPSSQEEMSEGEENINEYGADANGGKSVMHRRYQELRGRLKHIQKEMKQLSSQMQQGPKGTAVKASGAKTAKPSSDIDRRRKAYERAYEAFLAGDYPLALRRFEGFLKAFPDHELSVSAQVWLAEIYNQRGEYKRAANLFARAKKLHDWHLDVATGQAKPGKPKQTHVMPSQTGEKDIGFQKPKRQKKLLTAKRQAGLQVAPQVTGRHKPDYKSFGIRKQPGVKTGDGRLEGFAADIGDRVFFGTDSVDLSPEAEAILHAQAGWLLQHPDLVIMIEGHADERGTREYNLGLAARRAEKVKSFFVANGVDPARIRIISYGKERPVALCDDISCWAQNRRVVTSPGGGQPLSKPSPVRDLPKEV